MIWFSDFLLQNNCRKKRPRQHPDYVDWFLCTKYFTYLMNGMSNGVGSGDPAGQIYRSSPTFPPVWKT